MPDQTDGVVSSETEGKGMSKTACFAAGAVIGLVAGAAAVAVAVSMSDDTPDDEDDDEGDDAANGEDVIVVDAHAESTNSSSTPSDTTAEPCHQY